MDTLPVINKSYDLYKMVVDINNHLEKRWRYSLGLSLEHTALALMQELIMAKNAPRPHKQLYLIRAQSHIEISMLKLRLCLELRIVNETKIFQAQSVVTEIGRMSGGWAKSLGSTPRT